MIQPSVPHVQSVDWKKILSQAVREPAELLNLLDLPKDLLPQAIRASELFPLRVPHGFIKRMQKGDPEDPLLLQVLPLGQELKQHPDYSLDPVGDLSAVKAPGLLQKYHGRALIIATGACGIHCRYCFRRAFPYADQQLDSNALIQVEAYLRSNPQIKEVILSGGDPLVISNNRLRSLFHQFEQIPHIRRLRIHSRMPVVIPERIDQGFLDLCQNTALQIILVVHCNHANEIDTNVGQPLQRLRNYGITLLNQAVLLKNINDNAVALVNLSEKLFSVGVQPYYLHQLDRVSGAGHFEVDDSTAMTLIQACREKLPGYLVPRLVREIEGKAYKLPL